MFFSELLTFLKLTHRIEKIGKVEIKSRESYVLKTG